MKIIKNMLLAIAILGAGGAAPAQDINPSWTIQPNLTALKPDRDFGTGERDYGGGVKFGKPVAPMWDIQLMGSHARVKDGAFRYHQTLAGADALLMMSRQAFRPFLLVGAGAERDKVDNPLRNASKTSPYFTAGLGFQLGFNDQWSMQADWRSVRGRLHNASAFGFDRSNNNYLTIGLNYAFSKPAPPPPAAPPAPPPQIVQPAPPPPPAPVPPPPPPARFEKVTLSSTELFAFDSAVLTLPQPKLDDIAAALSADPSITDVDITGYADRLGKASYNQRLSEQRANAVRDYLVGKGIAAGRLKAYGKGEADPVVVCTDKKRADLIKCLEPNRRVEVEPVTIERRVQ